MTVLRELELGRQDQ